MIDYNAPLVSHETNIPGLIWIEIPVRDDNRGWFKENWQREKMMAAGLPDFGPVQNNMSFNGEAGTTRGIHAEPWDKLVSIGTGRVFGAWVDLREGDTFGETFTLELDPSKTIFVPRGVANSFQVLEENTLYSYLVNDHWSADGQYAFLNLADETVAIDWPLALAEAEISEKDKAHPRLADVTPIPPRKTIVLGSKGQLGRALQNVFPNAEFVDREEFDITDPAAWKARNWRQYETIINAAAYTNVDGAETEEGKELAWKINADALTLTAQTATQYNLTLVHISSDYVFDGTQTPHTEDERFAPLNVYGQTKAAGDIAVATTPKHYILRTSWVVGDGKNFIEIMKSLAEKGIQPNVVNDQIGRLTFTADLAAGIAHLLSTGAAYGTYNLTNSGNSVSWADIAKKTFELTGHNPDDVTGVSTKEYYADKEGIAPRPLQSTLNIDKIQSTGFTPRDLEDALQEYIAKQS